MKKLFQIILLFIMMLCPVVAWSGDISKGSLDKLMVLSGLNKQMSELPNMVINGMEESSTQESEMPDVIYNDFKKAIEKSFLPADILKIISQEIKQNFSEAEARKILEWYESDIGRKITKAEEAASTPAALEEMRRQAAFLISDQERLALAEKIENVTHGTDMVMRMNENTSMAVFSAFASTKEQGRQEDMKAFKAQLSEKMQESKPQIREMIIVSNIYSLKDIDIAGIEKYIKFMEIPAAQKFNKAVMKGMEKAFAQSTEKLVKSMAASVKNYKESLKKQPQMEIKKNDNKEQVKDL